MPHPKKLFLFNTMSRQKEEFVPLMAEGKRNQSEEQALAPAKEKDFVGIYSCWPTVYSDPHIGNLRAYVFADILRNVIKNILGYPVRHVVNITDVGHLTDDADQGEDKIEKAAKKEKLTAWDIARKYEQNFKKYLEELNIQPFDVMPRATEHIDQQIELTKKLEEGGYTYQTEDGIYMDTSKVPDYGKLAKLDIEGLKAWARVELGQKRNPTDFALWKFSPKDQKRQMERDSPWGKGFPGWHIECSAMSSHYLGEQFDIHTWGVDHIPVHHTNEIAQSECWYGVNPWVKYWMHVQFLTFKGEKASKSKGNVVTLPEIEQKGFDPLDLRYLFLTAHYRSFLDFTWDILQKASKARKNLLKKISKLGQDKLREIFIDWQRGASLRFEDLKTDVARNLYQNIESGLLDDLNTPVVLAHIHKVLDQDLSPAEFEEVVRVIDFFDRAVLKLDLIKWAYEFLQKSQDIPEHIQDLAEQRWQAKQQKDWQKADQLREQIRQQGFEVMDSGDWYEIYKR